MQSKTWNIKWKYIVEIYPSAFPQKWIFYLFYVLLIFILPVQFINRVKKFGSTAVMKEESHRESAPCSPLMSTARRTLSPCKGHCSPSPSLVFREILFGSLRLGSVFEETYKYKCKGIIWKKNGHSQISRCQIWCEKSWIGNTGCARSVLRVLAALLMLLFFSRGAASCCCCFCRLRHLLPPGSPVFYYYFDRGTSSLV